MFSLYRNAALVGLSLIGGIVVLYSQAAAFDPRVILAASSEKPAREKTYEERTPEERMERRYPQPVNVGFLIGLPVLDFDDRTIGHVQSIVRTPEGKIALIVPYGGFIGFKRRLVAVPIEVVGIAARQIATLDIARDYFDKATPWVPGQGQLLDPKETIRIALYRR